MVTLLLLLLPLSLTVLLLLYSYLVSKTRTCTRVLLSLMRTCVHVMRVELHYACDDAYVHAYTSASLEGLICVYVLGGPCSGFHTHLHWPLPPKACAATACALLLAFVSSKASHSIHLLPCCLPACPCLAFYRLGHLTTHSSPRLSCHHESQPSNERVLCYLQSCHFELCVSGVSVHGFLLSVKCSSQVPTGSRSTSGLPFNRCKVSS